MKIVPSCVSLLNTQYWVNWAHLNGRQKPIIRKDVTGSLRALEPFVGKVQAAALTQLGFYFDNKYEIPGVGLVLLDQASPTDSLYIGQASVLHWIKLDDKDINSQLRSFGILSWWESK